MDKPKPEAVRRMLDDIESVMKSRFYEDPDPIASPIEVFRVPEGRSGGRSFRCFSDCQQYQVLSDYTHWEDYERNGISMAQLDQVFYNVVEGLPRSEWLAETGLDVNSTYEKAIAEAANRQIPDRDNERER